MRHFSIRLGLIAAMTISGVRARARPQLDDWTVRHFQQARQAQQDDHLELAEAEYRQILSRDPRFAEAYLNLGIVYQFEKKHREAISAFEAGLAIKPDMVGALVLLGTNRYMIQDFRGAQGPLQRALRLNPKERQAGIYLALTHLALDQPEKAARQLQQTQSYYPEDTEIAYYLGRAYIEGIQESAQLLQQAGRSSALYHWAYALSAERKNDRPTAIQEYLKTLSIDPNIRQLYCRLATLSKQVGLPELAAAARQRAALLGAKRSCTSTEGITHEDNSEFIADLNKKSYVQLWEALPRPQLPPNTPAVADAFVNAAVEKQLAGDPKNSFSAGFALYNDGDYKRAEQRLDETVRRDPGNWVAAYLLARAHLEDGDYDRAEAVIEDHLANFDHLPSIAVLKIEIQSNLAFRCYDAVLAKQPGSLLAKVLLAKSYAAGFQPDKAIAEYQEILKIRPSMPDIHLALGELYQDRLHWSEAIQEYRAELDLNPENGMALALLGHAYAEAHDADDAIIVLNKVLGRYPGDGRALADLGKAWMLKNNPPKAIHAFERALLCDATQYELHYRLFQLYRSAGQEALAQKHLRAFQAVAASRKKAAAIVGN